MDRSTRDLVRERAEDRCEYCQLHQDYSPVARLQIEHIRPKKHGGTDAIDNLALACIDCNLRKGPNLTGIDPETDQITELFNPRLQNWELHFQWEDTTIVGTSGIGRTTVRTLDMNSDERKLVRVMTH